MIKEGMKIGMLASASRGLLPNVIDSLDISLQRQVRIIDPRMNRDSIEKYVRELSKPLPKKFNERLLIVGDGDEESLREKLSGDIGQEIVQGVKQGEFALVSIGAGTRVMGEFTNLITPVGDKPPHGIALINASIIFDGQAVPERKENEHGNWKWGSNTLIRLKPEQALVGRSTTSLEVYGTSSMQIYQRPSIIARKYLPTFTKTIDL